MELRKPSWSYRQFITVNSVTLRSWQATSIFFFQFFSLTNCLNPRTKKNCHTQLLTLHQATFEKRIATHSSWLCIKQLLNTVSNYAMKCFCIYSMQLHHAAILGQKFCFYLWKMQRLYFSKGNIHIKRGLFLKGNVSNFIK